MSEPDEGHRYALQKGFSRASGDVVAWQNADDYYEPNVFGQVMRVFQERPDVNLVFGNIAVVDEDNKTIDELRHTPLYYPLDIFSGMPFQNHAAFFRRSLWEQAGGITLYELNFDVDLIFRIARLAHPFFIHRTLGAYRNHAGSAWFSGEVKHLEGDPWVIRRRFMGRWSKLPTWCFSPVILIAKARRYAFLACQGDWDYLLRHAQRKLYQTTATSQKSI